MLTGRFSSACINQARSYSSSKGWRVPYCLTTRGITSSAVSKVVKRSRQDKHSLRRRTWSPSATSRESITLVSASPQKGQCIIHRLRKGRTRVVFAEHPGRHITVRFSRKPGSGHTPLQPVHVRG